VNHLKAMKASGIVLLVAVLFLVHGIVLYRVFSHVTGTIVLLLIVVVLVKHVGVIGPMYGFFKRRSRG
jgi:hypothetical protein